MSNHGGKFVILSPARYGQRCASSDGSRPVAALGPREHEELPRAADTFANIFGTLPADMPIRLFWHAHCYNRGVMMMSYRIELDVAQPDLACADSALHPMERRSAVDVMGEDPVTFAIR